MPLWATILLAIFYAIGWIGFIVTQKPYDATDGATMIVVGVGWPLFALGWLAARPFRYR
jgi:hypothetical protein